MEWSTNVQGQQYELQINLYEFNYLIENFYLKYNCNIKILIQELYLL
jgi:hypothetical protein